MTKLSGVTREHDSFLFQEGNIKPPKHRNIIPFVKTRAGMSPKTRTTAEDRRYVSTSLTVNILKFRTPKLRAKKGLDKECMPRSDCFFTSSLIRVFPVCYSDKLFVNSWNCQP